MTDERYILMNKNKAIASLDVSMRYARINKVYAQLPSYLADINTWVMSRTSLFPRENIVRLAKLAGISIEHEFLTISRAISINDTFWVNDLMFPTTWNEINPYTNRISKIMAEIALNGIGVYNNQSLSSPSPQYRIDGTIDKCVKRVGNDIYLYKTDGEKWSDKAGCRPYSEYYASLVCKQLGVRNYTEYGLKVKKTESGLYKPYTYCKIFTNETNGLLQIGNSKYHSMDLERLMSQLDRSNRQMANDIREMLLIDSLMLNTDRHAGNYGFLVNNDTYKIIGMAPLFDNDCSLGALTSLQYKSFDEAYNELMTMNLPKTNTGGYNDTARLAMTPELYSKLKNIGRLSLGTKMEGLSDRRFQFMEYLINRRKDEILSLFK